MPDGSGRIGPSLIGPEPIHARSATGIGHFEAVLGSGLGAMQLFRDRLTQDEILRSRRTSRVCGEVARDGAESSNRDPLAVPRRISYGALGCSCVA
jgi:hypothetical protein